MIGKYLQALLVDNKRVIIPDFGGFVVKRGSGNDIVSFNSFLKFNDGLLIAMIVKDRGVDENEATKLIQDELEVVESDINSKGAYVLGELGFLIKNKKGIVELVKELPAEQPEGVEDMPETISFEDELPVDEKDEMIEEVFEEEEDLSEASLQDDIEEEEELELMAEDDSDKEEDKATAFPLWYWGVAAVVVFLALWFLWLGPSLKEKREAVIAQKADVVIKEVAQKPAEVKKFFLQPLESMIAHGITVVADKDIAPLGKEKYNIIVASFSIYDNADEHHTALNEKGFMSAIFDRYNGFYAVSIGACSTLEDALKVCGENVKEVPGVWILVK